MEIICLVFLFLLGAVMGSFSCCQAWRIRYKELGKKDPGKRSVCLSCGKRLKASENIPIFSWAVQKGKCKSCGAKIGKAEILSEISLGLAFLAVGTMFLPSILDLLLRTSTSLDAVLLIILLMLLLAILSVMWILLIYDAKWGLLPTKLLIATIILSAIYLLFRIVSIAMGAGLFSHGLDLNIFWQDFRPVLFNLLSGVALLPGIYFLLYAFSKEKLVGGGDWLLALAISLILSDLWLCLLVLFLSNFMASIFGLYLKIKKGKKTLPFGPFLIFAFVIVYCLQAIIPSVAVF